jgi:hypothetical protein
LALTIQDVAKTLQKNNPIPLKELAKITLKKLAITIILTVTKKN